MLEISDYPPDGAPDLNALLVDGPSAVLVREIGPLRVDGSLADWSGPLPIAQPPGTEAERRGDHRSTDATARKTLIAARQSQVLYGGDDTKRLHRITASNASPGAVMALELLLPEGPSGDLEPVRGMVAVHIWAFEGTTLDGLHPRSKQGAAWWSRVVDPLLPGGTASRGGVRAVHFEVLTDMPGEAELRRTRAYGRIIAAPDFDSADLEIRAGHHPFYDRASGLVRLGPSRRRSLHRPPNR